jgi:hypothetical protein
MNKLIPPPHAELNDSPLDWCTHHALTLVFESKSQRESLEGSIIQQAICGPVLILDAGNCFNPLRLTRQIRRRTYQIQPVLDRIQVARAFTCFQVVSLLEQTRDPKGPVFILRLLTSFADEMIPVYERLRLLKQVDMHIDRLRRATSVTVMIKNTHFQGDPLLEWLSQFQSRADEVVFPELGIHPLPATLF